MTLSILLNYTQRLHLVHRNFISVRQLIIADHCPWQVLTLLGQGEGRSTHQMSDFGVYTVQMCVCVCMNSTKAVRDMLCHGRYVLLQLAQLTLLMASQHVHKPSCSLIRRKCHCLDLCLKGPPLWTETESTPLSTGAALERLSLSLLTRFLSLSLNPSIIAFPVLSQTRGGLLN